MLSLSQMHRCKRRDCAREPEREGREGEGREGEGGGERENL